MRRNSVSSAVHSRGSAKTRFFVGGRSCSVSLSPLSSETVRICARDRFLFALRGTFSEGVAESGADEDNATGGSISSITGTDVGVEGACGVGIVVSEDGISCVGRGSVGIGLARLITKTLDDFKTAFGVVETGDDTGGVL